MRCETQEEIGERENRRQCFEKNFQTWKNLQNKIARLQSTPEHAIDFDVPLYNTWKQQERLRLEGAKGQHPGGDDADIHVLIPGKDC